MDVWKCGCVPPFFYRKKVSGIKGEQAPPQANKTSFNVAKNRKKMKGSTVHNPCGVARNFIMTTKLRNKILTFRDLLDLPPWSDSSSTNELLIWTLKDLHKSYHHIKASLPVTKLEGASLPQVLELFCTSLKSLGDMWANGDEWMDNCKYKSCNRLDLNELEQLALTILEDINKLASERLFDMMDEDEDEKMMRDYNHSSNAFGKALSESFPLPCSPATPTSVIPGFSPFTSDVGTKISYSPSLLVPLRVQAVGKLNPVDAKSLSFHMFPRVDPKFVIQISKTIKQQQSKIETEYNLEVKSVLEDEVNQDCEMLVDTVKDKCRPDLEKVTDNDQISSQPILKTLGPNVAEEHSLVPTLTPPLETTFSSPTNEVEMQMLKPLPPPQLPSSLAVPDNMLIPVQVSPPPPPPLLPPPSSLSQNFASASLPSLPPLSSITIVNAASSQLPPPPPPPPPMTSNSIRVGPPPPLPPPLPMTSQNVVLPIPPPPSYVTSGNMVSSSSPLSPPMGSSNMVPPPPPPPLPLGGRSGAPPPPPPLMGAKGMIPPPPAPSMGANGTAPTPPPLLPLGKSGAPPPPPNLASTLRPKKATTKLKRSSQMGNLYRLIKGKMEGSSLKGKPQGKSSKISAPTGGKRGMADALAEMTKRSSYFQQIEEDVKNHAKTIKEVKVAITSFQTSNMVELIKFHKNVESHLEKLTDESQVLTRFEDFPTKKLEALRMASTLYSKLDTIATTLQNWQIVSPVNQVIDKVESYFNKIKRDIDTLERTKDEEAKKFQSHKITFDFNVLVRIKESMVDISSRCVELVLKERKEAKAKENVEKGFKTQAKKKGSGKMLWKSFQFAYRVYTFAGGQDDRADKLTRELAQEIEIDPLL